MMAVNMMTPDPDITHVSKRCHIDDGINRKRSADAMNSDSASSHAEPTSKKQRINFHNIFDLIGSTVKEEENDSIIYTSSNREENIQSVQSTSELRCLTPQSLDGGSNQSVPDTHAHHFQTISTENTCDLLQRPPSLTPPTTPVPYMDSSIEEKKPNGPVGMKKARTMYKTEQVYLLEQVFNRTQYPDPDTVEFLSRQLGISEAKIKVMYQQKLHLQNFCNSK